MCAKTWTVSLLVQCCSVVKMGIQACVSWFALVSEDWNKITWSEKKKKLHAKNTMQNWIFFPFFLNSGIGHSAVQFCLGYYNPSE